MDANVSKKALNGGQASYFPNVEKSIYGRLSMEKPRAEKGFWG
jgi:hypothetical protein